LLFFDRARWSCKSDKNVKTKIRAKATYGRRKGGIFGMRENFDCAVMSIRERFESARLMVDPNLPRFVGVVP
jgi:hypothetical protein